MYFEKALNILGLKPNFTEAELKKVHRALVNEYHPDRNKNPEAEEKMKEINAAREFLARYLKNGFQNEQPNYNSYNKNSIDIEIYRIQKYDKLEEIIKFDFNEYKVSENIKNIIQTIKSFVIQFSVSTIVMKNKLDIDDAFNDCLKKIKNYFKKIKELFYFEYQIDRVSAEKSINYDCTLEEFYNQLLKIKNKYSKDSMIERKQKELQRIVNFEFNEYKLSETIQNIIKEINCESENFAFLANYTANKNNEINEITLDNLFNASVEKIKALFKRLKEVYLKEKVIDETNVEENINYNCTLKEFYDQLEEINKKYGKEGIINTKLEEEILKYRSYPGYEKIKPFVRFCKKITLKKIKENGLNYNQADIDNMHQSILKYFERYYSMQQQMLELEEKISKIYSPSLKENFKRLKDKFKTSKKFDKLEESIKELATYLEENYEWLKSNTKKENERKINEIYENLITRYNQRLKECNIITQQSEIDNLGKFLTEVLNLFKMGIKKEKNLTFFNMFDEISFIYLRYNSEILASIEKNLETRNSNIYIKKIHGYASDNNNFFYLDEDTMLMYEIPNTNETTNLNSQKVTQDNLEKEYILLEDFLENAKYIGENKTDYNEKKYGLLYEMHGYSLYIENDQIYVGYNKNFLKTEDKSYIYLEDYKDKSYLIELLKEQINKNQQLNEVISHLTTDFNGYSDRKSKK